MVSGEEKNNHDDPNNHQVRHSESVEEAVFKYVGVGLQDRHNDNDNDGDNLPNEPSLKEDSIGKNELQDTNKSNNNKKNDTNMSDMEWFFKNEGIANPGDSSKESQSVAMAAIAAAYASNSAGKLSNNKRSIDSNGNKKEKLIKKPKFHNEAKDDAVAVDPELATLDDDHENGKDRNKNVSNNNDNNDNNHVASNLVVDDNVSADDHLVRKAIIESHSITQQPDFQQYLNTEDDYKESKSNKKMENNNSISDNLGDHNNVDGKDYAELQKNSAIDNPITKSLQKNDYCEVLPKVVSASDFSIMPDDTHLIQNAVSNASASLGSTSQTSGKSFVIAEEEALEKFIEEYQNIKNMDRRKICERIWSNERRKDDFWVNICKVLPHRTRSSIYKHVRRKYHIFEQRGKWTQEEEAELARLCVEKEGQWSEIGKALGRMPEDCRDRWRNYVKCGDKRSSHKWSIDEENLLTEVINQMLREAESSSTGISLVNDISLDEDRKGMSNITEKQNKEFNGKTFKDIINWTIVSERMGGARSRIQCRYKWNKLVKKEALERIENVSDEDKKSLLQKLKDLGIQDDSQLDWNELPTMEDISWKGIWSGTELKLCYEKMRGKIKNSKSRSISDISKELLSSFED